MRTSRLLTILLVLVAALGCGKQKDSDGKDKDDSSGGGISSGGGGGDMPLQDCVSDASVSMGDGQAAEDKKCARIFIMDFIGRNVDDGAIGFMSQTILAKLDEKLTHADIMTKNEVRALLKEHILQLLVGNETDDEFNTKAMEVLERLIEGDFFITGSVSKLTPESTLYVVAVSVIRKDGVVIKRLSRTAEGESAAVAAMEGVGQDLADALKNQALCLKLSPKNRVIDFDRESERTQTFDVETVNLAGEPADGGKITLELSQPTAGTLSTTAPVTSSGKTSVDFTMTKRTTNAIKGKWSGDGGIENETVANAIPLCGFVLEIEGDASVVMDHWTPIPDNAFSGSGYQKFKALVPLSDYEEEGVTGYEGSASYTGETFSENLRLDSYCEDQDGNRAPAYVSVPKVGPAATTGTITVSGIVEQEGTLKTFGVGIGEGPGSFSGTMYCPFSGSMSATPSGINDGTSFMVTLQLEDGFSTLYTPEYGAGVTITGGTKITVKRAAR